MEQFQEQDEQEQHTNEVNSVISRIKETLNAQPKSLNGLAALKKLVEKIEKLSKENKSNIISIGASNCGKTTLFNSLMDVILADSHNNKNIHNNYKELLPADSNENTYFITVIESSPNELFYLEHKAINEDGRENMILFHISYKIDSVKKYLEDLDEKLGDKLRKLQEKLILNKNEKKPFIPIEKVTIMIPNFPSMIRLIDIPGISNVYFSCGFLDFLKNKCLLNIFLITKSITETKVVEADFTIKI